MEPDELREEADTFPTRGVNPESLPAPGSRPALCSSVGLVATLLGLRLLFYHVQGLTPLPMLFRPTRGLSNSAGIRPQGIPYKLPFIEFLEMPNLRFTIYKVIEFTSSYINIHRLKAKYKTLSFPCLIARETCFCAMLIP